MLNLELPVTHSEINALIDIRRRINTVATFIPNDYPPNSVYKILVFELICAFTFVNTVIRKCVPQGIELFLTAPIASDNPIFLEGENRPRFDFNNTVNQVVMIKEAIRETGGIMNFLLDDPGCTFVSRDFIEPCGMIAAHLELCVKYANDYLNKMRSNAIAKVLVC